MIGIAAALATTPALAQSDNAASANGNTSDEAIIVTAQRRSEKQVDVPISVTTFSQEQLTAANVHQLSDTVKMTSGLRFDAQASAVQPTIRGVGTAITTSGGGPNVGIYVDGFFQSNPYVADFQLMGVKNIQVLKGPQGTLFGRNTTGGAILVTTAEPSTDTSGMAEISYGRFNANALKAYITTGLAENVAFDLEGQYRSGDGYIHNIATGSKKDGKYTNWSIRTGLKMQVTDDVSVLLRYAHSDTSDPTPLLTNAYVDQTGQSGFFNNVSDAGMAVYAAAYPAGYGITSRSTVGLPLVQLTAATLPGYATSTPGTVNTPGKAVFTNKSDTIQGTIKADLGFADLTSYTQYRADKSLSLQDLDASALPMFFISMDIRDKTFSQEFLLSSKPGSRLQWTSGLNYFQNRDTWDIGAAFASPPFFPFGGSSTKTKSYAAFLDMTYELNDKLFLTAGGRYSHDEVTDAYFKTNGIAASYEGADGSTVWTDGSHGSTALLPGTVIPVADLKNNAFTPRVVLRYKPDNQSSIYASYTRGYKAGILNVGGLSKVPVKPETIDAFEVGYKFDNRKLAIELASFYYSYKNLQVSSYQSAAAQIRNAATSEIYGLEGQINYRVTSDFSVNASASWTHARYKSFKNAPFYSYCDTTVPASSLMACSPLYQTLAPGSLTQTTTDASGYRMQRSPEFTGNIGANYGFDLGGGRATLSGNLYYTSSFYFDPEQQFKQKAYELLSLRAQWTDPTEHYTLAVYGENVTNKRYQTQVLFNTLGIGSQWSSPATWGVSLAAKF